MKSLTARNRLASGRSLDRSMKSGTRGRFAKIADLDSPTKPPDGMPGFAAVNSVRERCLIPRNKTYGTTGMYDTQGGQNSHRVLRRSQPSRRRLACQGGWSFRKGAATRRI